MQRKSRIDAPGALHHIIARGIDAKGHLQRLLQNATFRSLRLSAQFLRQAQILARSEALALSSKYSIYSCG